MRRFDFRSSRGRLASNISATVISNIAYTGMQWATFATLLWMAGPAIAGIYSFASAIAAPVFQLLGLQLRAAQATDHNGKASLLNYAQVRFLTSILAIIIIALLSLLMDSDVQGILLLIGFSKFVESFSDLAYGYFQKQEDMFTIARSLLMRSLLGYGTFIITYYLWRKLDISLVCLIIVWIVILLLHDFRLLEVKVSNLIMYLRWPVKISEFGVEIEIIKICIPLGVIVGISSLASSVPNYFLSHFHGYESVGRYASLNYVNVGLGIVFGAVNQNLLPRFAKNFAKGNYDIVEGELAKQVKYLAMISLIMMLTIGVLAFIAEKIMRQTSFDIDLLTLLILGICVGTTLISSALGNVITSMRIFAGQLQNNIIGLIVILVFGSLLIPRFGIIGAFISILLVNMSQIMLKYKMFQHNLLARRDIRE